MSWKTLWRPARAIDPSAREERRHRWRHFFRLLTSYFVSNQWKIAWPMLIFLVGMQFATVYGGLLMNQWEKRLFDSLEARRAAMLVPLLLQFFAIASFTIGQGLLQAYVKGMLSMRWRAWLTADYTERWLRHDRYYDIERSGMIDNPDQRIAEDLSLFTTSFLTLVLNVIMVFASLFTFGALLLAVSDPIRIPIAGSVIAIPGNMVIYAFLYAIVGTWLVTKFGKPLVRWTMQQQHFEANYRFRLVNVRRNAEQIAFAKASPAEFRKLNGDFGRIFGNFRRLLISQQVLGFASGIYSYLSGVLSIFLMLPKYFAGGITLGTVMQTRGAFERFNSALSFFVQAYADIATQIAIINRIRMLDEAIATPTLSGIAVAANSGNGLTAENLALMLPSGRPLARIGDWRVAPGERWTVRGPSGTGKSTLLRAVAGLWPYGSGAVATPGEGRMMFLSQRAFLPIGTLKEAMCFPAEADAYPDADCREALEVFRLGALGDELHADQVWQDRLSPGEQQRLAFVRVLLQRPDTLFLDEATSALDADNAAHAYQALLAALPGLTLVSVVHDPALEPYHGRRLEIVDGVARASLIADPSGPDAAPASTKDHP